MDVTEEIRLVEDFNEYVETKKEKIINQELEDYIEDAQINKEEEDYLKSLFFKMEIKAMHKPY